jgi:5-methylcytosine-specific restriction endonuclease McrA
MSVRLDVLIARDGPACHYCGVPTLRSGELDYDEPHSYAREATVDHRTPTNRGGTDELWNLVVACRGCNTRKNKRPYLDYVFTLLPTGASA